MCCRFGIKSVKVHVHAIMLYPCSPLNFSSVALSFFPIIHYIMGRTNSLSVSRRFATRWCGTGDDWTTLTLSFFGCSSWAVVWISLPDFFMWRFPHHLLTHWAPRSFCSCSISYFKGWFIVWYRCSIVLALLWWLKRELCLWLHKAGSLNSCTFHIWFIQKFLNVCPNQSFQSKLPNERRLVPTQCLSLLTWVQQCLKRIYEMTRLRWIVDREVWFLLYRRERLTKSEKTACTILIGRR